MAATMLIGVLVSAGGLAGAGRYEFVPDTSYAVRIHRPPHAIVGRLDAAGDFTETDRYKIGNGMFVHERGWLINVPPGGKDQAVYEFRSGILIPGTLTTEGRFVPSPTEKCVSFPRYADSYSPAARPVWNLPGYFRPAPGPARVVKAP